MITNYIKIAWKVLMRHPVYTFITLFGISLTLTVLMVLTSFLDHLIGAHYPETKRDRSLYIERMNAYDSARSSMSSGQMSFRFLNKYTKSLRAPERVSIFSESISSNVYVGDHRIKIGIKFTDAAFWQVAEFNFLEGYPYNAQTIANGNRVAVITDGFKDQYFGRETASVLGKSIEIEGVQYRVIGVVRGSPASRSFTNADVYVPYTAPKSNYQSRDTRGNYTAILLAGNRDDLAALNAEFQVNISRVPLSEINAGFSVGILEVPSETYLNNYLNQITRGGGLTTAFYGAIAFIIFMLMGLPAINLVNLNLSRILERSSEIGVRKAFGAPVRTLLWQFIIENVFITFIGAAIALLFTALIIHAVNTSGWIAYADLAISAPVFLISVFITLLFGLLSGLLPAFRMSKLSIANALKA